MNNRWINALVKTIIVLVIVHVIIFPVGYFMGARVGWFGIRMFWPHWHSWTTGLAAVILTLILYYIIYAIFTKKDAAE